MKNNILDASYSMLLGHPWLRNVKVTPDWGNNFISIEGNNIVCTITITKHLDSNTKRPKVLLYYDFVDKVIDEKEDVLLAAKPNLFIIGTITSPKLKILTMVATDVKIGTDELIFDFPHISSKISMDTMPAHIKVQNMKMAKWNLLEEVQICPLNLGIHNKS